MRSDFQKYKYITSATTTVVKTAPGALKRVSVNTPVSTGTITIYDDVSGATTTPIAIITSTADVKPFFIDFDVQMSSGIQIVTTQAQNITVSFE